MSRRVDKHPILPTKEGETVEFYFNGEKMSAYRGEMISSALFAKGIHRFGSHHRDGAPQGIFCANGQCGQCLVLVSGIPTKACITPVCEGMRVESLEGLPDLPPDDESIRVGETTVIDTDVLIVGGGPAGLSAAQELCGMGVPVIIADDKQELGGKLFLQTHNFFGSIRDCFAGSRGMDIGKKLSEIVEDLPSASIWTNSPVVGVYGDGLVGILKDGIHRLVRPGRLIMATGAREKMLAFHGSDLPGVYGAGAFQTLVNRDLVRAADRLFILGGGNVGLIAAYQALQAGIEVSGIAEALPSCGGYKVHLDKLLRLGVGIYTSHTVIRAEGGHHLERVVISEIDDGFRPIDGTEKEFEVDTLLVAVGLSPVDELAAKAAEFGMNVYSAGDAEAIAEASAAMFSGRIVGREVLRDMGYDVHVPAEWRKMLDIMRRKPGSVHPHRLYLPVEGIYPVIRCFEEIPCNPCTEVCPMGSISINTSEITDLPEFSGKCVGCGRCVAVCPGLAITLVDRRYDPTGERSLVILPWEMPDGVISQGTEVETTGHGGETLGKGRVVAIKRSEWQRRRRLVAVEVPYDDTNLVAGMRMIHDTSDLPVDGVSKGDDDDLVICRCERVRKGEIRKLIRDGYRDIYELKAAVRVGMGPCAGKTCMPLIERMFGEEGIPRTEVTTHVERPLTQEVQLKAYLGNGGESE